MGKMRFAQVGIDSFFLVLLGLFSTSSVLADSPASSVELTSSAGRKGFYDFQRFFFLQDDFHARTNKSSVLFTLYTLDCQRGAKILIGKSDVNKTCFNPNKEVKILIHGYTEMGHTINSMVPIRLAYFRAKRDVNVVIADWSLHSVDLNYLNSALHAQEVGRYISSFVEYLQETTGFQNTTKIHMVGFSLGAHVAGLAARQFMALTGKRIGRITGLDPAGPKFHVVLPQDRIQPHDADFTDNIHGDTDTYGGNFQGMANFYPNGGRKQPGCLTPISAFIGCGHRKTPQWFAESILNPQKLVGCRCSDLQTFVEGKCSCVNRNDVAILGEHCNHRARGKYFLLVKKGNFFNYEVGIYPNLFSFYLSKNGTFQNHSVTVPPLDGAMPTLPSINYFDLPTDAGN